MIFKVTVFLTDQGKAVLVTGKFALFIGLLSRKEHDSEKKQGECKPSQEAIHHSAYGFFLFLHPQNCNRACSMREKCAAEGLKQPTFIIALQLSVSLFYLPARVDNISPVNSATPLVALDPNGDNIKRLLQKDTKLRKPRKLK